MTQYKSFKNEKQKLQQVWNEVKSTDAIVSNNLRKISLDLRSVDFTKRIIRIPVTSNQTLFDGNGAGGGIGG